MSANDAVLFIDTNKYFDLYRTVLGKKLLAALSEQAAHIFVTRKVVDEVERKKVKVATEFVVTQLVKQSNDILDRLVAIAVQ